MDAPPGEVPANNREYARAPKWLHVHDVRRLGGSHRKEWSRTYREYVEASVREGLAAPFRDEVKSRLALGSAEFLAGLRTALETATPPRLHASLRTRASWQQVIAAVEKVKGIPWDEFFCAYGDWGRELALYLGRMESGLSLAELASAAKIGRSAVSMALGRFAERLKTEKGIRKACAAARACLDCEM